MLADPGDVAGGQLEVVEAVAVALGQLPGVGVGDAEAAVPVVRGAARVPPPVVKSFQSRVIIYTKWIHFKKQQDI